MRREVNEIFGCAAFILGISKATGTQASQANVTSLYPLF